MLELESGIAYSRGHLLSLKSKFYQILGKMDETNQPVTLTHQEVEDFLSDLDQIDNYIDKMSDQISNQEEEN